MQNSWETVTVDNSPMRLYMSQPDGRGSISRRDRHSESRRRQRVYPSNDPAESPRPVTSASRRSFTTVRANPKLPRKPPASNIRAATPTSSKTSTRQSICCAVAPMLNCSKLGIVGFCMGGRVAFLMAAANKSFKAAVDFYGGGIYSKWGDRPAPAELVANVSCPVQGHFGELDKNPPPDEMRRLDAELTRLGKAHQFFFYADAPHGFNRSGWNGYRPEADTASWARTFGIFPATLR